MKKLILGLILSFSMMFAHADEWTGRDKELHFLGGAAIASAVTAATKDETKGFLVGSAVGLTKEIVDEYNYGGASYKDAAVTILGAYLGAKVTGFVLTKTGFVYTKQLNIF